jgi:molecular chaperone GrpE
MTARREEQEATAAQEAVVSAPEVEDAVGAEPEAAGGEPEVEEAVGGEPEVEEAVGVAREAAGAEPEAEETERDAVEVDLDELLSKAQERDEYLALAQRTQADFENYRKRMARDIATAEDRGLARAAKELLPALDNLEHALKAAGEHPDAALAEGIRLLQKEMTAALSRLGIEAFSPTGEKFDPEYHEAMATQPADGAQPGTVLDVYQQGYRIGDSVIRPARVVVAG